MLRCCVATVLFAAAFAAPPPLRVGTFSQQTRTFYTTADGLPDNHVSAITATRDGTVYAGTARGLAVFLNGRWKQLTAEAVDAMAADGSTVMFTSGPKLRAVQGQSVTPMGTAPRVATMAISDGAPVLASRSGVFLRQGAGFGFDAAFARAAGVDPGIRQIAAGPGRQLAVAALAGLFERDANGEWRRLFPRQGSRSWAPHDVRAVGYDGAGQLHFGSAQGVGLRAGSWKLFTSGDGLPYDDFTSLAAASDGSVWYGTRVGAIHRAGAEWEYRQGQRWLPDDAVHSIAMTGTTAWVATAAGVSRIEQRPETLAGKALFFEEEIDRRHRRTEYGYVLGVRVKTPGDASEWTQTDSDNDGLWTAMYGAGECFACAATRSDVSCQRAKQAFEALRFLGTVTQGGSNPAPPGYVARTVLPASAGDPNLKQYTPQRDRQTRETRDGLWKVMDPRWPLSADGKWYWKADTSSDELDGHYFFYALYYDLAAKTEDERKRVREHVAALTDHLVDHNFQLIDHDGLATRWGVFNPEKLNRDPMWWEDRGLNSISILSYLKAAEHITGDPKYARAAEMLRERHAYDTNTLIAKTHAGAGAGNQSDDEMAFMCLYNLMKYETDPRLRMLYGMALRRRWEMEERELSPLFHFIAAAGLEGVEFVESPRRIALAPAGKWQEESAGTLRRFPLDRFNWALKNGHRKDIEMFRTFAGEDGQRRRGHRKDGRVLPVDERYVDHWNHDPWQLDYGGDGRHLADGAAFLLPYYMGLHHRFIE